MLQEASIPMNPLKNLSEYNLILDTWADKGIKPKFHVSEQGSGKIGRHSDYIDVLQYLLNIPQKYGVHIDVMIEAKMKEPVSRNCMRNILSATV